MCTHNLLLKCPWAAPVVLLPVLNCPFCPQCHEHLSTSCLSEGRQPGTFFSPQHIVGSWEMLPRRTSHPLAVLAVWDCVVFLLVSMNKCHCVIKFFQKQNVCCVCQLVALLGVGLPCPSCTPQSVFQSPLTGHLWH